MHENAAPNNKPASNLLPEITFPADLPVSGMRAEIAAAIAANQVVIVAGETGSGKTTQLPKIALSLGRKAIAHTQPRRIAARAVAERIAEELNTKLGDLVGYQVRFTDKASKNTRIKLVTDGILLNAIHHDRLLKAYDTIIIDEAHERSLNIDFLLGYLRTLLPKRPDLKVIITSATIDPESFAKHFAINDKPAPVISVSGRSFPVEIRYRPLVAEHTPAPLSTVEPQTSSPLTVQSLQNADQRPHITKQHAQIRTEKDMFDAVCDAVLELLRDTDGDILAFFAGEGEIKDAHEALTGAFTGKNEKKIPQGRALEILPLYGRLSAADQHRVFSHTKPGTRRVVLATNVAETSLTVPNITAVIDTGTARISRYSSRSKVQRLPIESISQASATQRAGRAGRLMPGVAIRLYSEEDFESRPLFTDPEILRTGLAAVLLQMLSLGLGDVKRFPFLTPPDARGVRDGLALLAELGAVHNSKITAIGRALARIPLEPRFARMLVEAHRQQIAERMIPLVAGLTIPDVRERPEDSKEQAAQAHARFNDPLGDLHTLLNLYDYLRDQQQALGSSAFRRQLRSEYLNVLRVREWFDLTAQLERAVKDLRPLKGLHKTHPNVPQDHKDLIHYCVLAGLLSHLGIRDEKSRAEASYRAKIRGSAVKKGQEYLGSRGTKFVLHPSSVLAKKPPETVMSVELVETSRLFARLNAVVTPEWAEQLAGELAKSSFAEPRWSRDRGAAVATERVQLFGVPIVTGRIVPLKKFDTALARELFIREALVNGDWKEDHAFQRHNRQLKRELEKLEETSRQRGLLADEEHIYDFYAARIPESVASSTDFSAWWTKTQKREPKLLHLSREDLLREAENAPTRDDSEFPRVWSFGDQQLGLRYRFEPGAADDGVTVVVPLPLLPRLRSATFEQLVPGMRHELVAALIKTLPKPIRKHVVPANDWAKILLDAIGPQLNTVDSTQQSIRSEEQLNEAGELPQLTKLLAKEIRRRVSMPVVATDFELDRLPPHLRPTFRIVGRDGRTLSSGKDLTKLQHKHKQQADKQVQKVAEQTLPRQALEQTGLTAWPEIPGSAENNIPRYLDAKFSQQRQQAAGAVRAYPCLVDRKKFVDLGLAADANSAAEQHRLGVRRLVALSSPPIASYLRDNLSQQEKLLLAHAPYRTLDDLFADVSLAIAADSMKQVSTDGLLYEQQQFAAAASDFERRVLQDSFKTVAQVAEICGLYRQADKAISEAKSLAVLPLVADAKEQLTQLIFAHGSGKGFISNAGLTRLSRFPVYLQALIHRMQQLQANPGKDRTLLAEFEKAAADFKDAGGTLPLPETTSAHLQQSRWLLEEFRVSLFAQHLGTAEKVSLQRIRKALRGS